MSLEYKGRNIQYIASDLDGTLLFGEGHRLDDDVYDLIRKCIENDILFIVASGRTYENEITVLEPIVDQVSYIAGSGTMVITEGKTIVNHIIPKETVSNIIDISNSIEGSIVFISTSKGYFSDTSNEDFIYHMRHNLKMDLQIIDDFKNIKEPIEKISTFYPEGSILVRDRFASQLSDIDVVTSGPQWLDFLLPNVNKGSALKELLAYKNINPENGLAFGDQENDVEMIQTAGIGYAMATGTKKAKEEADYIIESPKTILKELLHM